MDTVTLAAAADGNLAAHFTWIQRQTAGMRTVESPELVLTDCGMPCDTFNAVCQARLPLRSAADRIREAIAWFGENGHPFSWWVGIEDRPRELRQMLADQGLEHAESELAMAATLSQLPSVDLAPNGLVVRRVETEPELAAFAEISAANWSPPDRYVIEFYRRAARLILGPDPRFWFYLGWLDGTPVSTAQLTIGGGVGGLYNISTVAGHRRRGYGTALTAKPLVDARAAGLSVAILQAAPDAVGVYRRLGFSGFGEIVEYKPRAGV